MTVRKSGDWAAARRLLAAGPTRLKLAIGIALKQEAQLLRKKIVQGLTRQAPGGRSLAKPSPLTLATRRLEGFGGTKALLVRGDLRNAVSVVVKGDEAFIGIPRKARSRDGEVLIDVAEVQEFGSAPMVIPMTPAMRAFLFKALREAGIPPSGGSGRGVVVVKVPARPFLRPAFESFKDGAQKRFLARIAGLTGMGGV